MADNAPAASPEVVIERRGAAAVIGLNRPAALNAVNAGMRQAIGGALPRLARDPDLYVVIIKSLTDRAFCVGGDIRELAQWARANPAEARRSLGAEYALNWLHECFSKPTVSLIDGPVMGTGVGLTLYGTHRVAGERYAFAMPETAIGFFPDDGLAYRLARLPHEIGLYLGLTGRSIGPADALGLGLATHCIASRRFAEIEAALVAGDPVDPLLDERHEDPGSGTLAAMAGVIARCFAADTIEEITARLAAEQEQRDWCEGVLGDLAKRSPLALAVTLQHIRRARALDLRLTLQVDYRLACRMLRRPDFLEGVRAMLIDRDKNPRWRPARHADVSAGMLERMFAPTPGAELILPTRQEMQAARV